MNNIYSWRDTPRIKGLKGSNPQEVGEHLEAIGDGSITNLKPDLVVKAAETDPVLNPHFEWDDTIAGHRFRLGQARHLISSLRVERLVNDKVERVNAFVSVRADNEKSPSYRSLDVIENSEDLQRALLARALQDLRGWMTRYSMLAHVCDLLRPALNALEAEQSRYDQAAEDVANSVRTRKRAGGTRPRPSSSNPTP